MWTIWNGEPMKKEEIRELEQIAEAFAPSVEQIADGLYDHPEIKYEEFFAYKTYTDYLKRQGMTVTEHAADIATAFVASYKQGGKRTLHCPACGIRRPAQSGTRLRTQPLGCGFPACL